MANRNKTSEKIKYLVERGGGKQDFIMEIPASWKVTFAYVNPSTEGRGYPEKGAHCIRVWEGEKLRAVFSDCRGLRDLSIPLAIKVVEESSKAEYKRDSFGNFEGSEKTTVLEEFIDDPIEPPKRF